MRKHILISITLLLATFVLYTSLRIEYLNLRAGSYLPRQDRNADGSFSDGKWRVSSEYSPRDQLREVVATFGLMQYLIAPLLLMLTVLTVGRTKSGWGRLVGCFSLVIALFALTLMYYREYYTSLGY
ncbi:MAG: hypothetical protein ND895_03360 [Pyrinomonadaceae bacterium]|nr:hypothetical protein [Pyrinomonadaceae bacterium]